MYELKDASAVTIAAVLNRVESRTWGLFMTSPGWAYRAGHGGCVVLALTLSLVSHLPASARTIVVNSNCTLVNAITAANTDTAIGNCAAGSGPDTIRLTSDVTLTVVDNTDAGPNGLPTVSGEMTIDGSGFSIARDPSAPSFRILMVGATGDLTLRDVEVTGGEATARGGCIWNGGVLALFDTMVRDNSVSSAGGPVHGGGVYSSGPTAIVGSKILGNSVNSTTSPAFGGGIYGQSTLAITGSVIEGNSVSGRGSSGGGVMGTGSVTVADSTVHLNTASATALSATGGGIEGSPVDIFNSTISGNSADEGSGLSGSGSVVHSTFHGNTGSVTVFGKPGVGFNISKSIFGSSTGDHCGGVIVVDGAANRADDASCDPAVPATLTGLDPVLADNGGPTMTHALLGGSTAINKAGPCGKAMDQRGAARKNPCDSGAFEEIGCALLEKDTEIISGAQTLSTCSTALLGPDVIVEAPNGSLTLTAGARVTIEGDFVVDQGAKLVLGIDPLLLPP